MDLTDPKVATVSGLGSRNTSRSSRIIGNYILNAEVGVEASLTKKVSLRVVAQDTYDSEPAPDRKSNDFKLIAGLNYKF